MTYDPFLDDGLVVAETASALKALALGTACVASGVVLSTSLFIAGLRWLERQVVRNGF